ncbi:helix-turn-helix domain-containing protein [Mycobacteroides abscessus]|uniref:helix-turn-helix domain-containing protein n=1 Tax=Mycobacteroides abscessus TaxID=36809 RepID=UPI003B3A1035
MRISVRQVHKLLQGEPETLHDLIQRLRVEHAERLMSAHPELGLESVAHRTGFGSTRTLGRAFRRVLGESPRQRTNGSTRPPPSNT